MMMIRCVLPNNQTLAGIKGASSCSVAAHGGTRMARGRANDRTTQCILWIAEMAAIQNATTPAISRV
jgi:hypothetical protein